MNRTIGHEVAAHLAHWQERALKAEARVRDLEETVGVMVDAHRDHTLRPDPCACHRRGRACQAHGS